MVRPARFALAAVLAAVATAGWCPAAVEGVIVKVPSPITSEVTNQVRWTVEKARTRADKPAKVVVFDFNPGDTAADSPDFGPCHDLARSIRELANVHGLRTVAFVHRPTAGHSVLPVLACTDRVMATDATLGPVARGAAAARPDEDELRIYGRFAPGREAVVTRMLDRDARLMKGTKGGAEVFVDGRKRAEAEKAGVTGIQPLTLPSLRDGVPAAFTAGDAVKVGLCGSIRGTAAELVELLDLTPTSLRGTDGQDRPPQVWSVRLTGPVNRTMEETLRRRLERALSQRANVIVLELDCGGGETQTAINLAEYLRGLSDPDAPGGPVRTIAYIPKEAPDTATFLALGCSEIAMAPKATLGSFEAIMPRLRNPDAAKLALAEIAAKQNVPKVLIHGLFERDLVIRHVQVKGEDGAPRWAVLSEQEVADLGDKVFGKEGPNIKNKGELLKITGEMASNLNLALLSNSLNELYAAHGFDPEKVRAIHQDTLDILATFLCRWEVTLLLVMTGIACLILELKMPGVGVPGVIAVLCFVLFFWAHSQYSGQLAILAGLLFLMGLALLGVEIFVLPGFGVTGVSGIVMMIVGLGLATLDRMPQTPSEWQSFGHTVTLFGGGLVTATLGTFLLVWFLPHIPFVNRLIHSPPEETEDDEVGTIPAETAALLGAVGVAATVLRPAGMARFGDRYIDVVSDGSFVPEGASVQVIEIEGNRIVVKVV
jgi:membrane-bound serine protease (ClpP class)